ncbi:hypothetical protein D3C75_1072070 [compost metagenome]
MFVDILFPSRTINCNTVFVRTIITTNDSHAEFAFQVSFGTHISDDVAIRKFLKIKYRLFHLHYLH